MKKKLFPIIATLALGAVFAFAGCGENGKSAYDLWLEAGNSGTVEQFLESLKGENGTNGENGAQGPQGEQGPQGPAGPAGPQGGTLAADCNHVFVEHVLEYATCSQASVVANVCTICNGYEVEVGEKNPEVHGSGYEWVETADNEMKLVLVSDLEVIPGTAMEEANGACELKKCNDCGEMLKQHAETAWYPVDEKANVCEEAHLEVEACTVCHAAVSDVQEKGARGHVYSEEIVVGAAIANGYEVELTCETCDKKITVNATVKSEKIANCKEGGYKIYEYTFNNFLENITREFKYDVVGKTTEHTFGTLMVNQGATLHFLPENTAELDALFASEALRWTEGEPGDCSNKRIVGGDCDVCNELVTFWLYGKHTFGNAIAPDCTTDGKYVCSACGFDTPADLATGHVWSYKSIDTTAGTMTVACSCGATDTVAYTHSEVAAENCTTFAQDVYTATFSNGLPAGHANVGTQTIVKKINKADQKAHTVVEGVKYKQGANVQYTDTIDALIAAGTIRWTEGEPGICSEYKIAGFDCAVCDNLVTINLSGKHTLSTTEDVTPPTCTTRGYTTKECVNCHIDVEVAAVDAKGHTYAPNAASLAAFVAAPANGGSVVFECACGDSITLNAVLTTADSQNGCVTIKKSTYTFTKNYTVESAVVGETVSKSYTYAHIVDKSSGSHTLGNITNLQQGAVKEYNDAFAAAIAAGTLRWAEGEPAECNTHNIAGFTCSVCDCLVTIELSGEHDIANAQLVTVPATCTTDGYSYKVCADCGTHVIIEEKIPATGHAYGEWSVIGADKDNAGYAECICATCGDTVTVNGVVKARVEANCGKDGYVTYKYVDANGTAVVEEKTFVLARTGLHNDVEPLVRIEFVNNGYKYTAYFCDVCECYVVESRVAL